MDFKILVAAGREILIQRHVENEIQYVSIKTFIKGDVYDPETMVEERAQFPSRVLAMDFVENFSEESAENWFDSLDLD